MRYFYKEYFKYKPPIIILEYFTAKETRCKMFFLSPFAHFLNKYNSVGMSRINESCNKRNGAANLSARARMRD